MDENFLYVCENKQKKAVNLNKKKRNHLYIQYK